MDNNVQKWLDGLSEQDIPAETVNWEAIIEPEGGQDEAGAELLDAEATIGDPLVDQD